MKRRKTFGVRLDESLIGRIEALAAPKGITPAELVRLWIADGVIRTEKAQQAVP